MGFNFRKSLKITPGVRLNVTKKGISSVSVGPRGAKLNVGKKGTKATVSLPGTGLSYTSYKPHQNNSASTQSNTLQTPPQPMNPIVKGFLQVLAFTCVLMLVMMFFK